MISYRDALAGLAATGALLSLAACTISPNTGADGGADAQAPQVTTGEQCTQIFDAYCTRASNCLASSETLTQCVADGQVTCCGSKCSSLSASSQAAISACVSAIQVADCNAIATMTSPPECAGIPRPQ